MLNLFVHQNIVIHTLRIDGISQSSVFQIGSAGVIKSLSQFFNTGGFIQPAPLPAALPPGPSPFLLSLVEPTPQFISPRHPTA